MAYPAAKSGFSLEDLTRMGPDQITRQRKLAEAMLAESQGIRNIRSPMEGFAQLAQALVGNIKGARLDRAEREGKANAGALFSAGMGMGEFPPAPSGSSPATMNVADGPKGQESYAAITGGFEEKAPQIISRLSNDLGITPEAAAGVVGQLGHESEGLQAINERNPTVPGSRGGFGWAQWTGPRRKQFEEWAGQQGLDPKSDDANYGFLLHELKNTPEAGVLADLKGAGDAQTAGRIFTDKFLRPGIPGYGSRAKWTDRALAAYQGAGARPAVAANEAMATGQPVQVASLDPSVGMPPVGPGPDQAAIAQALIEQGIDPNGPQAAAFASLTPGGGTPAAAPVPPQPPTVQAPLPQQQQMAQALIGGQPDPAMTLGAPPIQPGGPDMRTLMNMAGNEFMSPQQQRMIEALTGRRMEREAQQQDPAYQMDLDMKRAQLEKLRSGEKDDVFAQRAKAAAQFGLDPNTQEGQNFILSGDLPASRGGAAELSLNTIPGVDKDGNPILIQVGKDGVGVQTKLPEGVRVQRPPMIKDTGTEFQIIDPMTREVVRTIPKNVAGAETQKAIGRAEGEAAFDLPRVEQNAVQTLDILERMKTHPGREGSTGFIQGMMPARSGDQVDFQSLVDQTQGQSFLQAFQTLKGGGAITETEGAKATTAISRLGNQRLSDDDYLNAIADLEDVIRRGLARAKQQAGAPNNDPFGPAVTGKPVADMTDEELEAIINGK